MTIIPFLKTKLTEEIENPPTEVEHNRINGRKKKLNSIKKIHHTSTTTDT